MLLLRTTVGIALLLAASVSSAQAAREVCNLLKSKGGLSDFAVEVQEDGDGNVVVEVDLDGDGQADKLVWFRTGSASLIPPDDSSVTLTLSAMGKTVFVGDQRILLAQYKNKYYVMASSFRSGNGLWRRSIFSVGPRGFSKLCTVGGKGLGP